MIQMKKAAELQQAWRDAGSPECKHERLEKEYALSADTGDSVCLSCGEAFSKDELRRGI